jgi:hypothetical protein
VREFAIKGLRWAIPILINSYSHPAERIADSGQAGLIGQRPLGIDFTPNMAACDCRAQNRNKQFSMSLEY